MNKPRIEAYKIFAASVLCAELIICVLCGVLYAAGKRDDGSRLYRVEAERVARELRENAEESGNAASDIIADIDLSKYRTIVRVSEFYGGNTPPQTTGASYFAANNDYYAGNTPPQTTGASYSAANNDYIVADAGGTLYRIEYVRPQDDRPFFFYIIIVGIFWIFTAVILWYVWKKILKPFHDISELPVELAKGNLAMPIREEKSKYFGRFLWGMNMLRETLEAERQKELELQKEKKTLLLSLSHDIRTPLSAIELYGKALSEHLYDTEEKQEEALRGIAKNTKDIRKYIDEITQASKEDFLNLEVKAGEFYLSEVMRDLETYYRDKLSVLHTEFSVEEMPDCLLKGDRDRVTEILQNLMENAVKYGDGKYIRIFCDEEEDCRLIAVENGGCTLKQEELPHLFDVFYRGSNSRGVSGSGLGLYICRELVRRMDGDIFVSVNGDVFRVTVVVRKL